MIFCDVKDNYPFFYKASVKLEDSCFFFKNMLTELKNMNLNYEYCEDICEKAFELSDKDYDKYYENLRGLVLFSLEFLKLQVKLVKTGRYLYSTFEEVDKFVYNDPSRELAGPWYMMALFFSQIFWVTHCRVNMLFLDEVCKNNKATGEILEVPSGTGIFISNFLIRNTKWKGSALDLSESSIEFAKRVINTFKIPSNRIRLFKDDFLKYKSNSKYDIILCGEFLEHLEDPLSALKKLHSLVKEDGKVFVTVAVYASMIDHIYLYKNAQEVRDQIYEAGFEIKKELVQNVFARAKPEDSNTPINYSAILIKKKNKVGGYSY